MLASSLVAFTSSFSDSSSPSSSLLSPPHQHPFVLAFGTSPLTQRLVFEEVLWVGAGLLFPLSMALGFISIRLAALYNPLPQFIRYDVWNIVVRFIMADVILEWILLPRFQCVMNLKEASSPSSSYFYTVWGYQWEWTLQSLGYGGCQRTTTNFSWEQVAQSSSSSSQSSDPSPVFVGTPTAMGIIFAIRLLWICAGVYLGEGFFPICLTGGIACGKSTVAHYLVHGSHAARDDETTLDPTASATEDSTNEEHHHHTANEEHLLRQSSEHSHNSNSSNSNKPQRRRSHPSSSHSTSHHHPSSSSPSTTTNKGNSKHHHQSKKSKPSNMTTNTESSHSATAEQPQPDEAKGNNDYAEGSVYLVDTDSIAHDILLPPGDPDSTMDPAMSVYEQILQAFGQYDILEEDDQDDAGDDQQAAAVKSNHDESATPLPLNPHCRHRHHHQRRIDRRKLGAIVFADRTKRRTLNQLTHPRIRLVLVRRLLYGLYGSGNDLCVSDVPLLLESGGPLRWIFGLVVLVTCRTPGLQLQRLIQRNPDLTLEQCQQRIDSQMSLEEKEKKSHLVLDNSTSRADLAAAVERAREDMMMRVHGMGISLFQMLLILGGSVPVAVLSKMYTLQQQQQQQQ